MYVWIARSMKENARYTWKMHSNDIYKPETFDFSVAYRSFVLFVQNESNFIPLLSASPPKMVQSVRWKNNNNNSSHRRSSDGSGRNNYT